MFAQLTLWLPRADLIGFALAYVLKTVKGQSHRLTDELPWNQSRHSVHTVGYEKLDRLFVFIFWAIVEDVTTSFNIL